MDLDTLAVLAQDALWLALKLSLPVLGAAFVVALLGALLQNLTQLQDAVLGQVPRLLAVAAVLALFGVGLGGELVSYTRALWAHTPELGR
jgi:flagellar biosynthetic protein FliQ